MTDKVKKEIEELIEKECLNCSIEQFKDEVSWNYMSIWQTLSENLIKECKNKVNWSYISCCQALSKDFIKEFKYKLDLDYLLETKKISEEFYYSLIHEKVNRFELMEI